MQRNERKKTNKRQLLLSILAVFSSVIIATTAIFAWFSFNDKSDIGSFDLAVSSQYVGEAAINSYAIQTITKGSAQNTYKLATANNRFIQLYSMPSFDEHGIVLNNYQPALAINFTFSAYGNIMSTVRAKTIQDLVSEGVNNWLSNCVQFDVASYNGETLTLTTDKEPTSFVGITQEGLNKSNEIEIFRGLSLQGSVSLWFVVEYNRDVMLELHSINEALEAEVITFANDITFTIDAI